MNRKTLSALIALSLGGLAANVQAQDFDNRWYVTPYLGGVHNDDDRLSDDGSVLFGLGIGRYVAPNAALDFFVDRTHRGSDQFGQALGLNGTSNTMFGAALRYFFGDEDSWQPYLMAGLGANNHRGGFENGWDIAAQVGGGLQRAWTENSKFRAELGYRYDFDDETIPSEDHFGDIMLNLGVTVALGGAPEAAPSEPAATPAPAAAVQPSCSDLDDDKDGVNNCDDKCSGTPAGTIVGPDGCAQEVVIDLRGVEFYFDCPAGAKCTHSADSGMLPGSIEILDQAVDVLSRYPNIRVEVAGHTDSTGPDGYNQGLSERRASVVFDYLTSHGIDASRLVGPNGYGESRPIDTNDTKEGRQRNRRTELPVQK
jgi:OOP family OmpA-OmpF porin